MKKILASLLAITMLMTTLSTCIIPASADEVATAEDPNSIYFFDFEGIDDGGKDWIDNIDENRYVTGITGVEKGAITINKHSEAPKNHEIKVTTDPAGSSNKVLMLKAGEPNQYGSYANVTKIRFNADGKTGIPRSEMGNGKKLVYETKIYLPSNFAMYNSTQLVNMGAEDEAWENLAGKGHKTMLNRHIYVAQTGLGSYPKAEMRTLGSDGAHNHAIYGRWVTWKHVVDVSQPLSETHADTARAYLDDRLITARFLVGTNSTKTHGANAKYTKVNVGDDIIDFIPHSGNNTGQLFDGTNYHSIGDAWWGSHFTIRAPEESYASRPATFYIDDVKAYWIDALTYTTTNAAPFTGGPIEIKFNQPIRETVEYYQYGKNANFNYVYAPNMVTLNLDGLFTIVNATTKDVVPGAVTAVTLSNDGKTVSITPNMDVLGSGGNYQIKISEYLIDENGQGLENNSEPTYIDLKTPKEHKVITLFEEDFDDYTSNENWLTTENATKASEAGYTSGTSNYRTADGKWDIQTNGVAADANDFVGVVEASTVPNGVTGNFSGKVLKIDETGATSYAQALCVRRNFNDGAISLTSGDKRLIYEADIYCVPKKGTIAESAVAVHAMKVSKNEKQVYEYGDDGWKNVFLGNGTYRMQEGAYAYSAKQGPKVMWTTELVTPAIKGKKLRMVVDQSSEKDSIRMYVDGELISNTVRSVLEGHARNGMVLADAGPSNYMGQSSNLGNTLYGIWNSGADSTMYIDNFKAYLVDNFEVESVEVEGNSEKFNTEEGIITYTFTKPVDQTTAKKNETIVLLNGNGEIVAGGIDAVTFEDDYTMKIKLSETLSGSTQYTIKLTDKLLDTDGLNISLKYYYYNDYNIDDYYTKNANGYYEITAFGATTVCTLLNDERGNQGIKLVEKYNGSNYATYIDCYLPDYSINGMKTEVKILTAKSNNVSATADSVTVADNKVSTSVSFANNGSSDATVWCVIAVFGEDNVMLGCHIVLDATLAAGTVDVENVEFDIKDSSTVESVKMFVWDSAESMKAYQKGEDILNK